MVHQNPRSEIQEAIGEFRLSQLIAVAARLGVADHLVNGPRTVRQLAQDTGSHEPSLYRVLRALAGAGIFAEEDGPSFRLTPAAEFLRSDVTGREGAKLGGRRAVLLRQG